jgi:hypothetical protein
MDLVDVDKALREMWDKYALRPTCVWIDDVEYRLSYDAYEWRPKPTTPSELLNALIRRL